VTQVDNIYLHMTETETRLWTRATWPWWPREVQIANL